MLYERAFPEAESGLTHKAITTGRMMMEHGLSWKPVVPDGAGRSKRWPGVTDAQWRELYDVASSLSVKERAALCERYQISYQSLKLKSGNASAKPARAASSRSTSRTSRTLTKEEILDDMREQAHELATKLAVIEAKIDKLEAIDDELFNEIRNLVS